MYYQLFLGNVPLHHCTEKIDFKFLRIKKHIRFYTCAACDMSHRTAHIDMIKDQPPSRFIERKTDQLCS
jgi:hypothetical protein